MKTTKLFKSGHSQVLRLPKEFEFEVDRVYIKKMGFATMLLPYPGSWQTWFESIDVFSDDFMEERQQPSQQER